jgi:tryptophan synthase alpha chain
LPCVDAGLLRAIRDGGADALEVGIPFSDPVMDGGIIQEASRLALEAGTRPADVLEAIAAADLDIPVAVMTYLNPVWRHGAEAFLREARAAGVDAVIVPDLPVDEADEWVKRCAAEDVAAVFLVAPGEREDRRRRTAELGRGFVYCVGTYGVTGERDALSTTAAEVVSSMRSLTDLPLLVGVGIGSPKQASEACAFADGVIVGSAIVRPLVAGDRSAALSSVAAYRRAVPEG